MRKNYSLILIFLFCFSTMSGQTKLQFTINQPPLLTADAGASKTILTRTSTVLGGAPSASGGSGNYTYLWSPSEGLNQNNIPNPVATPSKTTQYTLTVNDGRKCSVTAIAAITVSSTLGTEELENESGLLIYPNPSRGTFSIKSDKILSSDPILIEIFNVLGSLIYSETVSDGNKLNKVITIPNKSSGIYYLRLTGSDLSINKSIMIL